MDIDIFGIVRDVLVIAYMFVLRIGVPLIITLMLGAWLKRLLEKEDAEEQPQSAVTPVGSNGKHCWATSKTPETEQAKAIAATRPDLPCWLALQVAGSGLREACYNCPLYTAHAPVAVRP